MLHSTTWFDKSARDVLITALLMAEPHELKEPTPQIRVDSLEQTGWTIPPGWYGIVPAASSGIAHSAGVPQDEALGALRRMGEPEPESRSQEFDGRRMVRINGGYIVLNYMRFRDKDYTSAARSRRYRERKAARKNHTVTDTRHTVASRDITQAYSIEHTAEKNKNPPTPLSGGGVGVSKFWTAPEWHRRFGLAWAESYKTIHPPMGGDGAAKATGDLSDQLAALNQDARLAAQERAGAMFSEFLSSADAAITKARHPWSWFVTRFGGLLVPAKEIQKSESFADKAAREKREAAGKRGKEAGEAYRVEMELKQAIERAGR